MIVASGGQLRGSVVVPAYQEATTIAASLHDLVNTLTREVPEIDWEVVVVDDGSSDGTSEQVAAVAPELEVPVRLLRHLRNTHLGGALRTGLSRTAGDVVLTVDCDLTYSAQTVASLARTWLETRAHVVIASPYMPGGRTVAVPTALERRSRAANRILRFFAPGDIHTFTGMVRAYDGAFARSLRLKAVGPDVNVEIIYKAVASRATIVEVPAALDWSGRAERAGRTRLVSRMSTWTTAKALVMGFLFRPYSVPLAAAAVLLLGAVAAFAVEPPGWALAGAVAVVVAGQLGLGGVLALQAKRYFDEGYVLGLGEARVPVFLTPAAVERRWPTDDDGVTEDESSHISS